jgi:voltage-gated sodium channel
MCSTDDVIRTQSAVSTEDVQRRVSNVLFQKGETRSRWRWAEFVEGARFELVIGALIMLNGLQMALEVQHSGLLRGYDLGYRGYATNPDPWPGAEDMLKGFSIFFGVVFSCEVSLKICALRGSFFKSYWNLFDLLVVLCFLVELCAVVEESLAETTVLRLARLARLLRLVRVVRQIRSFDALFLMTTAIKSSAIVLAWSCMLLFMIQVLVAFLINQLLDEFYFQGDHPQDELEDIFEYWGSFSRALLSTFEMTLANWPPVCRMLMENVNEWFMVICLLHKLTVGFAVIGIINGVFIQETFRVAAQDDFIMMHQKEAATRTHMRKMERLFMAGDTSGNGFLDKMEFMQLITNVEVSTWLSSMGLEVGDADALFEFMDTDNDHKVSVEELVHGVETLKGTARSLDLLMCLNRQDEMHQALLDLHPEIRQRLKERRRGPSCTSRWAPSEDAAAAAGPSSPPATATPSRVSSVVDVY